MKSLGWAQSPATSVLQDHLSCPVQGLSSPVDLAAAALLAAGIWGYNSFRLKEITVEGLSRYTKDEFIEILP